jgi:hypothetical protein
MILTVTDMNRLEQAARVSMGEFQDPESSASPLTRTSRPALRFAAFALIAAVILAAACQLF